MVKNPIMGLIIRHAKGLKVYIDYLITTNLKKQRKKQRKKHTK